MKRLGAVLVAVALVLGAWVLRNDVLDGDDASSNGGGGSAGELQSISCVDELATACRAAAAELDADLRIESSETTFERWGTADIDELANTAWVTLSLLPEMAAETRVLNDMEPLEPTSNAVASSPIVLVVAADRAPSLTAECGNPVDWRCLGELAGSDWSAIDSGAAAGTVRPGFARHPDTAIGRVGVGAAVLGAFGGAPSAGDPDVIVWGRQLAGAVPDSALAADTAVQTIQVRPSALDIAVGARAELTDPSDPRFTVVGTESPIEAVVVVSRPLGGDVPDGFTAALGDALAAEGWEVPPAGFTSVLTANDLLTAGIVWEDLA